MKSEHFTDDEIDQFVRGYVDAGCWADIRTEGGDKDEEMGSEAYTYGVDDLDPESALKVVQECISFMDSNEDDLRQYIAMREELGYDSSQGTLLDYAGHDFYLTAAGHGAGFWDRGLGELGDRLTAESKPYTINDVWLDSDGKVHFEI